MRAMIFSFLYSLPAAALLSLGPAPEPEAVITDTLSESVLVTSYKQVLPMERIASPVSEIGMAELDSRGISDIKKLSSVVPNLHIPDYGSSMTSSIYLRGFGSRIDNPVVGMYVDDIPVMNKNAYDMELADISSAVLLRGPQSTLYGRNSMCGVLSLETFSPENFHGNRLAVEYGNGRIRSLGIEIADKYDREAVLVDFSRFFQYQGQAVRSGRFSLVVEMGVYEIEFLSGILAFHQGPGCGAFAGRIPAFCRLVRCLRQPESAPFQKRHCLFVIKDSYVFSLFTPVFTPYADISVISAVFIDENKLIRHRLLHAEHVRLLVFYHQRRGRMAELPGIGPVIGAAGPYVTSETKTVTTGLVTIAGPAADLGEKPMPFAFWFSCGVSDQTAVQDIAVRVTVDGREFFTGTLDSGAAKGLYIDTRFRAAGQHTIAVTASKEDYQPAAASYTFTVPSVTLPYEGRAEMPQNSAGQPVWWYGLARFIFGEDGKDLPTLLKELQVSIPKIITGSYQGTGQFGSSNPNTLAAGFRPRVVLLSSGYSIDIMIVATESGSTGTVEAVNYTLSDTGVSWYASSAAAQGNESGKTYRYVMFG